MERSEHAEIDLLRFFEGRPVELGLYQALEAAVAAMFPEVSLRVQKTQISFYGRHLFAAASLPLRRRRDWPERCLLVTFGLARRVDAPRIAAAVEPYPGRWTHHVLLEREEQLDEELLGWLREAYAFAESKK